jgi:hypothetical protein
MVAHSALLEWNAFVHRTQPLLEDAFGRPVPMSLGGSLRTGTFRGPKPSQDPNMVGLSVVELDGRIHLPDGVNPQDPSTIAKLQRITGLTGGLRFSNMPVVWGNRKYAVIYGRKELGPNTLEIECAVYEHHVGMLEADPAAFWQKVFTRREVAWTADSRQALRDANIGYSTPGGVMSLKNLQCELAKWRMLAGWGSGVLLERPSPGSDPGRLIEDWWRQPSPALNRDAFAVKLPIKPRPPAWVREAELMARRMRLRRFGAVPGGIHTTGSRVRRWGCSLLLPSEPYGGSTGSGTM